MIGALILCLSAAVSASAALPPQYERLAELRAILNDPTIVDLFDITHPIDKIELMAPDLYRVSGGGCHVDVSVKDAAKPEPIPGPRSFVLLATALICH
ncbi:MAG: hypothetical protein JO038_10410 [Alphaproteobacteria bacterium]|nr:hypothetical protein [Alphaproteobacteria bacterium]